MIAAAGGWLCWRRGSAEPGHLLRAAEDVVWDLGGDPDRRRRHFALPTSPKSTRTRPQQFTVPNDERKLSLKKMRRGALGTRLLGWGRGWSYKHALPYIGYHAEFDDLIAVGQNPPAYYGDLPENLAFPFCHSRSVKVIETDMNRSIDASSN